MERSSVLISNQMCNGDTSARLFYCFRAACLTEQSLQLELGRPRQRNLPWLSERPANVEKELQRMPEERDIKELRCIKPNGIKALGSTLDFGCKCNSRFNVHRTGDSMQDHCRSTLDKTQTAGPRQQHQSAEHFPTLTAL